MKTSSFTEDGMEAPLGPFLGITSSLQYSFC